MDPSKQEDLEGSPSTSGPRVRHVALQKAGEGTSPPPPRSKGVSRDRRKALALLAVIGIAAGIGAGEWMARAHRAALPGNRAWHGKVARIARSGGAIEGSGLTAHLADGRTIPLAEGAEIAGGMTIASDARTRARLDLDDGSAVVVDRATSFDVDPAPRTLRVREGALLFDVAHLEGAPFARLIAPQGEVRVLGTKLTMTTDADRTSVEVLRGAVDVVRDGESARVDAAQEAVLTRNARLEVTPANDLAQRVAFGERLGGDVHNEDADAPVSGLGELRARRPGKADEKDHAVTLAHHAVKIRIAGNVARTEIDETFRNDTGDDLEGVYRFPLPPGAQIERLALEVDGALVDGSFVDKAKAAAIWRGAIQHAAPLAPKPKEEIVWVPGPWRDPALLEWQRGGRFELKIFPIPKRGARRVVLAYTETLGVAGAARRYVYPLPQATASAAPIDRFDVDLQVLGSDPDVRVRGYELARADGAGPGVRFAQTMRAFTPSGDLGVEFATAGGEREIRAWGYRDAGAKEDPYVAIALRPRLPSWTDVRPRDHVIVLDAGRAMFGERFARAKRLAIQMTQEMDRRDRVVVLACDVACRALPGGFHAPGSATAHDVDAFLANLTPDGASDLVGAVRAAARVAGRDGARDLRVALVSDGAATAGYRTPERVAREVASAIDGDPRAEVIAVPVGGDADATTLQEIARGGGGVVVPYLPGEPLESAALQVLNAAYGRTLKDVELTLPEGLVESTPRAIAPLRAGGETIVTAHMKGDAVRGDVILRGSIGGERFEAKYPLDVRASSDAGNAFVPRLFAAARIADAERDGGDGARAELVALSQRYAVPSRFTSLLVLESEAMFTAFGIDRAARAPTWTGEIAAQASESGAAAALDEGAPALEGPLGGALASGSMGPEKASKDDLSAAMNRSSAGDSVGSGFGGGGAPRPHAAAAPKAAAPAAPVPEAAPAPTSSAREWPSPPPMDRRRRGQWMKRVWSRVASVQADGLPAIAAEKVALARAAFQAAPDERSRTRDLARALVLAGSFDELGDLVERWSARDPLDADAIATRADLAARRGDRDAAIRIAGGLLASSLGGAPEAASIATALAVASERATDPSACAFRVAAAELRPADADTVAHAVACEREAGRAAAADRWLDVIKPAARADVRDRAAKLATAAPLASATGDIAVDATWDAGPDLDLAIVDPTGARASWPLAVRQRGVRVVDPRSTSHEALAWSNAAAGSFRVEIARAGAASALPVRGQLTVRALGQSRTIPFVLAGAAAAVARIDVRWESRLVPIDPESAPAFDPVAAQRALDVIPLGACTDPDGAAASGRIRVAFDPRSGRVASATLVGVSSGSADVGLCVAGSYRRAQIPPFSPEAPGAIERRYAVPAIALAR